MALRKTSHSTWPNAFSKRAIRLEQHATIVWKHLIRVGCKVVHEQDEKQGYESILCTWSCLVLPSTDENEVRVNVSVCFGFVREVSFLEAVIVHVFTMDNIAGAFAALYSPY
jgi:hypothetical protein